MFFDLKILIIKLSSIGDIIHTLPALKALKTGLPDAKIDWLAEPPSKGLLECHPYIDRVFIFNKEVLRSNLFNINILKELAGLIGSLRKRRYDIVIDFQGLLKSGVLAFLTGGKRRIGFDRTRELSYLFLNEKLPPYNPDMHAVERYMKIPEYLRCSTDIDFLVPVANKDRDGVDKLLHSKGILKSDRIVLISPHARWETKLWVKERFVRVSQEIVKRYGCKVIFVGGKDASLYMKDITISGIKGVFDLTGQTNLTELACLMDISSLIITPDSAPMHLCAAMGTRVIALFGPTSPQRTGPFGNGHVVIRDNTPCSPCFLKKCDKNRECMLSISVEDVVKEAGKALLEKDGFYSASKK